MTPPLERFRTPERREADWKSVEIMHFTTGESMAEEPNHKLVEPTLEMIKQLIMILKREPQYKAVGNEAVFSKFLTLLNFQKRLPPLSTPQPSELDQKMRQRWPDVKLATAHIPIKQPGEHGKNKERVSDMIAESERHYLIGTSDSHSTEGLTLEALRELNFDLKHTAVLSFDHHADVQPFSRLNKAGVMNYILRHQLAQAVGCLGINSAEHSALKQLPPEKIPSGYTSIPGADFYEGDHFSKIKLQNHLTTLFEQWKQQGITSIIPSVDLDCLRLDTLPYTGVDYTILSTVAHYILLYHQSNQLDLKQLIDVVQRGYVSSVNQQPAIEDFLHLLQRELNYKGLPAAVVPFALQQAQSAGFKIGISHPKARKKYVGSVTEYTPADVNHNTAKAAMALIHTLTALAQR